jgi:hypothetical protein
MATMTTGVPAVRCLKFIIRSYALYSRDSNGLNPKSIPARNAIISAKQIERLDCNAFLNTIAIYCSGLKIKKPNLLLDKAGRFLGTLKTWSSPPGFERCGPELGQDPLS